MCLYVSVHFTVEDVCSSAATASARCVRVHLTRDRYYKTDSASLENVLS